MTYTAVAPNSRPNFRLTQRDQGGQIGLQLIFRGARDARNGVLDQSLYCRNFALAQMAPQRGQMISQLLSADLDNDGQITREELKDMLGLSCDLQCAAAAFFTRTPMVIG